MAIKTMLPFVFLLALIASSALAEEDSPLERDYDSTQAETYEVEFDKIDKYLTIRRTFVSVEDDMKNFVEMFRVNAKSDWWYGGAYQRALHLLATLSYITTDSLQCNKHASNIMQLCKKSARNLTLLKERPRRLDQAVDAYLKMHSKACEKEYATKLDEQVRQMDPITMNRLDKVLTPEFINKCKLQARLTFGARNGFRFDQAELMELLATQLSTLGSSSKFPEVIIKEFIVEPCDLVARELRSSVLEPLSFDADMSGDSEAYLSRQPESLQSALQKLQFCDNLPDYQQMVDALKSKL